MFHFEISLFSPTAKASNPNNRSLAFYSGSNWFTSALRLALSLSTNPPKVRGTFSTPLPSWHGMCSTYVPYMTYITQRLLSVKGGKVVIDLGGGWIR